MDEFLDENGELIFLFVAMGGLMAMATLFGWFTLDWWFIALVTVSGLIVAVLRELGRE